MKKSFCKLLVITLIVIFLVQISVYANEEEHENIEIQEIWNEIKETDANIVKEPTINSKAAVVLDRKSKTVIFDKNANQKRAMASTTKIMTAILVLEKGNLNDLIEVSQKAANTGGSRLGLKKGDKITLNDLLYGLMLRSRK